MISKRINQRITTRNNSQPTGIELFLMKSAKAIPKAYRKMSLKNGLFRNIGNNGIWLTGLLKLPFFKQIANS
jgi:hypothetical protein